MTDPVFRYRLLSLKYTILATRRHALEAAIDDVTRQMEETREEMERVRGLVRSGRNLETIERRF